MVANYQQRKSLADQALREALKVRRGISLKTPFDIFDFCTFTKGLEVRFVNIPSMEGMYVKSESSTILISSHRPMGRQYFSCAHELGHHIFNHGTTIDELDNQSRKYSSEEFLADSFAGFLLMPKSLVNFSFLNRHWQIEDLNPIQFYTVASNIGVGYSTLVSHLKLGLQMISETQAESLVKIRPKEIREQILGFSTNSNLLILDTNWQERAADVEVNDFLIVPQLSQIEGSSMEVVGESSSGLIIKAIKPGISRIIVENRSWAIYGRVRRKKYIGISTFRHDEDPEYDNN